MTVTLGASVSILMVHERGHQCKFAKLVADLCPHYAASMAMARSAAISSRSMQAEREGIQVSPQRPSCQNYTIKSNLTFFFETGSPEAQADLKFAV